MIKSLVKSRQMNTGVSLFDDNKQFLTLWNDLDAERRAKQGLLEVVSSPAFVSIIAMGDRAVPIVRKRLRSHGDDDLLRYILYMLTV